MNEQADWDEATDAAWREGFHVGKDEAAAHIEELEAALREIHETYVNNLFGYEEEMNRIARRALGDDE